MKKFKRENGGFTLIELVVVMIIIGILVLLATPRFIKYVREARYTNIINDIRTVETVSIPDMAKNNSFPKGTSKISINDFSTVIVERKLYAKDGYINQNQEDDFTPEVGRLSETYGDNLSKFYLLDKEMFVKPETRTRLKGDFFINKNGDVLYVDDRGEFVEDSLSTSNMYLYDSSNPGKIIGINKESPMWSSVNKKENPSYNPAFEGLSYEEVNWNEIISEEDFQEYKDFYEEKGMTLEDVRKTIYEVGREKYMMEFPGIPATNKLENNDRIDVTEIQDKAFMNVLFYGGFSGKNLEKIGNLAFFSSNFTGKFKQDKLETIGDLAFAGSNFTGELFAPSLKSIGYGGLQNSKFTGDFNAESLEILGAYALGSSEFSGNFNALNLRSIGEYNLFRSKFTGDFNTELESISRENIGDMDMTGFKGSLNAPNLTSISDQVFKDTGFTKDFNAPKLNIASSGDDFKASKFTGDLNTGFENITKETFAGLDLSNLKGSFNAPNAISISEDALTEAKFTGVFNAPNVEYIGDGALEGSKFTGVFNVPNVEYIGNYAFFESNFTGVFNAPNVKEIGDYALVNSKFTGVFNAPNVKYIGEKAFYYSNFTGDFNAANVEYIGDYAFALSKFTGDLNVPNVEEIGIGVFWSSEFTGKLNILKITKLGDEYSLSGCWLSESAFGDDNPQFSSYNPDDEEMINAIKSNKCWRKDGNYVQEYGE